MIPKQFGWLDTTIFIHVLFKNDIHQSRCDEILESLESGKGEAWIDPIVIHELTYVLPRALPAVFNDRKKIADYLLSFLTLDTLHAHRKEILITSIQYWSTSNVAFADARLTTLAESDNLPVCTVNQRDFPRVRNTYYQEA